MPLTSPADITRLTAYQTPCTARSLLDIASPDDLPLLQKACSTDTPHIYIGGGTNILMACDTYEGTVIRSDLQGVVIRENTVTIMSGESLSALSHTLARDHGCEVFERWIGLPGTVGGAIVGNAGCYGLEMSSRTLSIDVYNIRTDEIKTIPASEMGFGYRTSRLQRDRDLFVISATLDLTPHARDRDLPLPSRTRTQPRGRTCGSFFRNPPGDYAGRLIEAAGLKGYRIGDAMISDLHANFIMNMGNADWRDILAVAEHAKQTVYEQTGIRLVEEVRIVR